MEKIKLDLVPSGKMPSLHASQYDDGREHGIDLFENGVVYKLDGTETLTINERKGDDCICSLDIENTFTGSNHIVFASTEQMCAVWGNNICELVIKRGNITLGTLNFILEIEPSPTEGGIESESEISNLERQITEITEQVIGDDYYTADQTDEAIATATEGKADTTYVNTELAKKADKTDTYTKTQVDNALNNKMDKANPTGTGSFSLNRKAGSTIGTRSFAEGYNNTASGNASHAEGRNTTASGNYSHSEGYQTTASESDSHAEGYQTTASGFYSHAEGYQAIASGSTSHAEGNKSEASGINSHAEGSLTIANHKAQHVFGEFNVADDSTASELNRGNYVEIVGNGTSSNARSNARTLDWQGNETLAGDVIINGNQSVSGEITRLDGRIDNLPAPMIFKGTLGVGGTIQTLPTASASNEGWTYKVITDGTYAGQTAKVGDVFTSNGSAWVLIPSGDEDNDTWRNIKVNGVEKLGNGISSGAVDFVGSENIEVEFDANGNKVGIKTKNIYTKNEVDDIVYNILPDDTASGPVANFGTSLALPIKSLEIDVKAVQESGTPTPSTPKAISGWSEISLAKCGANLWDEETENGYLSSSDGSFISHANSICSKNYRLINPSAQVYVATSTDKTLYICWYDEYKAFISRAVCGNTSVTSPLNARYFKLSCYNYGSTYNNDTSVNYPSNDTTYHAYNVTTEVINLGGTYYGGHFTQDKDGHRQFVVTHNYALLNDDSLWQTTTGTVTYAYNYAFTNRKLFGTSTVGVICSAYPIGSLNGCARWQSATGYYFGINDNTVTLDDIKALARNGDIAIVYEIAVPIVFDLPDGEPIATLIGTNNIYADTGDTKVVFKCSVNDYVSAHSGGNLLGMGGVYLGGAKSGGSEEEPTEESEDTEKVKLDDPKEEIKTIGNMKKLGGE